MICSPEVGVRAIDEYEFEARDITLPFEERSELEERSHASNEKAKHAFEKIGKVATSILRREEDDKLQSRDLEERSHASNEKAKHAFEKIGRVATSILRRTDDDIVESRSLEERSHASNEKAKHAFQKIGKVVTSIVRRGILGIADKLGKGAVKGVEKLAHKKKKAPSAPQPQQTQSN